MTREELIPDGAAPDGAFRLGPRLLHWSWIAVGAIPTLRVFALPLLVFLFTGEGGREAFFYSIVGGVALLLAAWRAALWSVFRYEVASGELRVRSGLLARREQFIPIERIHAVDLDESLLQRLFGVVRLKIETAAGGSRDSDVVLETLTRADAATLRESLQPTLRTSPIVPGGASRPPATADGDSRLIRALSPVGLLAAGATAGQIGPALAILFAAYQFADDLLPDSLWRQIASNVPGVSPRAVIILAVVVPLSAWLLTLISTVFAFARFELRRDGDHIVISSGLLDRRRSTIPLSRVQAVVVSEGILRQPFGLAAVRIESAGYGRDTAVSGVLFPLIRRAEIPALLAAACPAFAANLGMTLGSPPTRARARYVARPVRGVLLLAAMAVGTSWVTPWAPWWWGPTLLTLAPIAALLGLLRYLDAGWALDEANRLVIRVRHLGRVTTITTIRHLQQREVSRHPLQRRTHLATLRVAVASGGSGGRMALEHLDSQVAFDLLARLGPLRSQRG